MLRKLRSLVEMLCQNTIACTASCGLWKRARRFDCETIVHKYEIQCNARQSEKLSSHLMRWVIGWADDSRARVLLPLLKSKSAWAGRELDARASSAQGDWVGIGIHLILMQGPTVLMRLSKKLAPSVVKLNLKDVQNARLWHGVSYVIPIRTHCRTACHFGTCFLRIFTPCTVVTVKQHIFIRIMHPASGPWPQVWSMPGNATRQCDVTWTSHVIFVLLTPHTAPRPALFILSGLSLTIWLPVRCHLYMDYGSDTRRASDPLVELRGAARGSRSILIACVSDPPIYIYIYISRTDFPDFQNTWRPPASECIAILAIRVARYLR